MLACFDFALLERRMRKEEEGREKVCGCGCGRGGGGVWETAIRKSRAEARRIFLFSLFEGENLHARSVNFPILMSIVAFFSHFLLLLLPHRRRTPPSVTQSHFAGKQRILGERQGIFLFPLARSTMRKKAKECPPCSWQTTSSWMNAKESRGKCYLQDV